MDAPEHPPAVARTVRSAADRQLGPSDDREPDAERDRRPPSEPNAAEALRRLRAGIVAAAAPGRTWSPRRVGLAAAPVVAGFGLGIAAYVATGATGSGTAPTGDAFRAGPGERGDPPASASEPASDGRATVDA